MLAPNGKSWKIYPEKHSRFHDFRSWVKENLSRKFSVLFKFGAWARPISGKLIQKGAFSRKMKLNKFRGVTLTDFWKTHPNLDEFSRNRSSSYPGNWNFEKKKLDEFSRNPSVSEPGKLKFRTNFWMCFPGFCNKPFLIRVNLRMFRIPRMNTRIQRIRFILLKKTWNHYSGIFAWNGHFQTLKSKIRKFLGICPTYIVLNHAK